MHVVEIFLPTGGAALEAELTKLRVLLMAEFGGFTAFSRAPAQGAWRAPGSGQVEQDDVIVVEVMCEALDRAWWAKLKTDLEQTLKQQDLLIRAHTVQKL
jgi:hypothetical protein